MVEDDLAHFAAQSGAQIVGPGFLNLLEVRVQPELALCIPLAGMDVERFAAFVGIEEEPPTLH